MSKTKPEDNAHPIAFDESQATKVEWGLTKREFFAAMAMQGLCASELVRRTGAQQLAQFAVEQADALILELSKEQKAT